MEIETLSEYGARQALGEYRNFFVDNAFCDDGFFYLRNIEVSRTDDKNKFIIQMSDDGSTKNKGNIQIYREAGEDLYSCITY